MSAKRGEIASLVIPLMIGSVVGWILVRTGNAWMLPLVAGLAILASAVWYSALAAGPAASEVEQIRRNLWLRHNPGEAAGTEGEAAEAAIAAALGSGPAAPAAMDAVKRLRAAAANATGDGDRAIVYVERVLDRQINKLRGILSFDALIIAFLSIERSRLPDGGFGPDFATACLFPLTIVLTLLVFSSVLCLDLFRVRWSPPDNFLDFSREHKTTVELAARRTLTVERAARLSEVAVVGAIMCFLLIELATPYFPQERPQPPAPGLVPTVRPAAIPTERAVPKPASSAHPAAAVATEPPAPAHSAPARPATPAEKQSGKPVDRDLPER